MDAVSPEPAHTYLQLRSRILSLDPTKLGLSPSIPAPHVWGVVMETGYTVGTATMVSLVDGTTSLYYSTGGGMLGSGEYTPVAEASKAFVALAENLLQYLSSSDEFPLPQVGQVRFVLMTYTGMLTAPEIEKTLASGNHPLSHLYRLGHETLTQLHLLAENNRK